MFFFSPLRGEDSDFDSYFSMGLKPATRIYLDIFGDLIIELLTE